VCGGGECCLDQPDVWIDLFVALACGAKSAFSTAGVMGFYVKKVIKTNLL